MGVGLKTELPVMSRPFCENQPHPTCTCWLVAMTSNVIHDFKIVQTGGTVECSGSHWCVLAGVLEATLAKQGWSQDVA